MKAKSSLKSVLPLAKELRSNNLTDIQNFLARIIDELDRQWRLLWQDATTIQVDADGFIYFGGQDTDGSWRIGRSGDDWILQYRHSGAWTTVDTAKGS